MKLSEVRRCRSAWERGEFVRRGRQPRVICPICDRLVAGYVPKKGDGSLWRPYRHLAGGQWCEGWLYEAELAPAESQPGG